MIGNSTVNSGTCGRLIGNEIMSCRMTLIPMTLRDDEGRLSSSAV